MSSPWKNEAAGAERRRGATLSEAMMAVVVAAAVFVPLLSGGVAYWMGARNLEAREKALLRLGNRLELLRRASWGKTVRPGRYDASAPPPWAPHLVAAEGGGRYALEIRTISQTYPTAFFGADAARRYDDLWLCTLEHVWPGGRSSLVTVKGGNP